MSYDNKHTEEAMSGNEISSGKNAVTRGIKEKMGICPYFGTMEILDDVLIQKEQYGGRHIPENTLKLSSYANFLFGKFLKAKNAIADMPASYYRDLLEEFLNSPKEEMQERHKLHLALKRTVMLRTAFMDERFAMEARIRNVGLELEMIYPLQNSKRLKSLEKLRKKNEPLLEDLKPGEFTWDNLITHATAPMGFVQRTILEKELEFLVSKYPIWEKFGAHIPGFGFGTCAFLIAKIDFPERFPDSGKIGAFAGISPRDGKPMKMTRGQSCGYNPGLKNLLAFVFPNSFMKVSAKAPDEPYSVFFQDCRKKQAEKAEKTTPQEIVDYWAKRGIEITDVENLGYKEPKGRDAEEFAGMTDEEIDEIIAKGKKVFRGFRLTKKNGEKVHFLNPGHVLQRAKREFGHMFLSDFYHAWLHLNGENNEVRQNPRIMAIFKKAGVEA